jgi:hypothetical protein
MPSQPAKAFGRRNLQAVNDSLHFGHADGGNTDQKFGSTQAAFNTKGIGDGCGEHFKGSAIARSDLALHYGASATRQYGRAGGSDPVDVGWGGTVFSHEGHLLRLFGAQ